MKGLCNCTEQGGGVGCRSVAWILKIRIMEFLWLLEIKIGECVTDSLIRN